MKLDRFDYLVWSILALLIFATLGMVIYANNRGVTIQMVFPQPDSEVSANTWVEVDFVDALNKKETEKFFEIEPTVDGVVQVQGNKLLFKPSDSLIPGEKYRIRLRAGLPGDKRGLLKNDFSWSFSIRRPSVVYIYPGSGERELWQIFDSDPQNPVQLTDTGGNIWDFAVAENKPEIVISVKNEEGGIDLWLYSEVEKKSELFVDCGLDRCYSPAWSPNGAQIAYSREIFNSVLPQGYAPARIWLADVSNAATRRLLEDSQKLGFSPSWSPDGRRLAMVDGQKGGVRIIDLQTEEENFLPTMIGRVGSWSPDGERMIFADVEIINGNTVSKVYLVDLDSHEISLVLGLFGEQMVNLDVPAWSPDGNWLLVAAAVKDYGPGKQLWLASLDEKEIRQITDESQTTIMEYYWSPDGDKVLFQRLRLGEQNAKPETWVWQEAGDEFVLLVENTFSPRWLP